jgi:hypothetical protein
MPFYTQRYRTEGLLDRDRGKEKLPVSAEDRITEISKPMNM